jgi:hypothetical protein
MTDGTDDAISTDEISHRSNGDNLSGKRREVASDSDNMGAYDSDFLPAYDRLAGIDDVWDILSSRSACSEIVYYGCGVTDC